MSNKMKKNQLKQVKNQSQSGRSMVEMLGVLAVIGVLSIGGIAGYRLAMNYYQASQIAHEMNMMRTDAQIKIAQGTENLTLGSPYDEHKINFNGYETAFGCKYVDENDIISEQTVSCQIANAYYIELPKIPNGVCQPLARLINGMDNLIAFSVNDSEYEEGGTCQEGENDLYAVFSGETVSDLTHCERDDDCKELENTPVCDLSRRVCVECTENSDCLKKGTEKPICNENKCEPCPNRWSDALNQCVTCTADEHCTDKEKNPVCNMNTGECEPCPDGQSWNINKNMCTVGECESNDDCKPGEYCYLFYGKSCSDEFDSSKGFGAGNGNYRSECRDVHGDIYKESSDGHFVLGKATSAGYGGNMTWWSVQRFCDALKMTPATRASIGCDGLVTNNFCQSGTLRGLQTTGFSDWVWLDDAGTSCTAYDIYLSSGLIHYGHHNISDTIGAGALCQQYQQ